MADRLPRNVDDGVDTPVADCRVALLALHGIGLVGDRAVDINRGGSGGSVEPCGFHIQSEGAAGGGAGNYGGAAGGF